MFIWYYCICNPQYPSSQAVLAYTGNGSGRGGGGNICMTDIISSYVDMVEKGQNTSYDSDRISMQVIAWVIHAHRGVHLDPMTW